VACLGLDYYSVGVIYRRLYEPCMEYGGWFGLLILVWYDGECVRALVDFLHRNLGGRNWILVSYDDKITRSLNLGKVAIVVMDRVLVVCSVDSGESPVSSHGERMIDELS